MIFQYIKGRHLEYDKRYGAIRGSLPSWCKDDHARTNDGKCKKLRDYSIKPLKRGRMSKVILR